MENQLVMIFDSSCGFLFTISVIMVNVSIYVKGKKQILVIAVWPC